MTKKADGDADVARKAAILEWQKKYRIKDGDPVMATVELFQIHFASWREQSLDASSSGSSYDHFRSSFEELTRRTKAFSKEASELTDALRTIPNIKETFRAYQFATLSLIAALAFALGVSVGKWLL